MTSRASRIGRAGTAAFALIAFGVPASAQVVTGTLLGTVSDESGAVLPGVSVTVSSPKLIGGPRSRTTDGAGEYRFPALSPGTYALEFALQGFGVVRREGIRLSAGAALPVDVRLGIESLQETVTVTGESPLIDVKSSQLSETAASEVIENIPTGRTFVDVFNLMPGVVYGNYDVATTGTNSVHGGSVRNNVFALDGVNVNDPLVAYPGTDVNLETIEEVQVTTAGMSAEFGSASGAVFNVITKSGSNELHGQVNGYLRDEGLQSDNITDDLRAQGISEGNKLKKGTEWGASLGGPVLRDRLWFFLNYQRLDETRTVIDYPPDIEADQDQFFGKLTAQIGPRNRIDGFYQYRLRFDEPFIPNVNEQDPRVWRLHRQSNNTYNVKWTSTLSDATFVEVRASVANQRRFTSFPNAADDDFGYRDLSTGARFGGWYRELARPGHRNSRTLKADVSHFAEIGPGSHEIKAGASYDWLINEETREWLAGARVHFLFDGEPERIQLSNAPVNQNGRVNQLALYVQDQWTVNPRLTLNLGLRFEAIEGWYPEGSNGGVNFPRQTFPEQRNVVDLTNLAPRLGLVFDLVGDRRSVLRLNYGRFYNQIYTSEFNAAVPFAFGSRVYEWNDLNGDLVYQLGEEGALISDSTVPASGSIDPDLRQSYTDSFTAGIDHELRSDLAVGVNAIVKRESGLAETINASRPLDEAYQPVSLASPLDGSPLTIYPLRSSFRGVPTENLYTNPGSGTCSFCPDLERRYFGLEFTLQKRMSDGWQLYASYVYSKSEGNKGTGHRESQGDVMENPNNLVFSDGRLALDRPHQIKVQATYQAPWNVLVSAAYRGQSGLPWARSVRFLRADSPAIVVESSITVNGEPIGAQRFDFEHDVSLRVEKAVSLGDGRRLGLILDVFNLLNANTVTSVQQTRIDHSNFGKPGAILLPRTLRLGARFQF